MILKTIRLKNIRSYIDEEIEFPEGSVLLAGDIGCGKSTVLLAIDFALFGLSRTELVGTDLLRHGKSFGAVELDFELDGKAFTIKRTLKRNSDSVSQDSGQLVVDNRPFTLTAMELKARVLEILGYPMEFLKKNKPVFRYTVYTPQEQMKHIMATSDRLEVLRKIFGIDKYGQIKTNCKLFVSELRAMKRELESFSRDVEEKVRMLEDARFSLNDFRRDFFREKELLAVVMADIDSKSMEIAGIRSVMEESINNRKEREKKEAELSAKTARIHRIVKESGESEKEASGIRHDIEKLPVAKPARQEREVIEEIAEMEKEMSMMLREKTIEENEIAKLSRILQEGLCAVCGQKVHAPESFRKSIEDKKTVCAALQERLSISEKSIMKAKAEEREASAYSYVMEKRAMQERSLAMLSARIELLTSEKTEIEKEILALNRGINSLENAIRASAGMDSMWKEAEAELEDLRHQRLEAEKAMSRTEQQIEDTESRIRILEKEIEEKSRCRQKISAIAELSSWLEDYFSRLMDIMEKHVMYAIQKQFDEYFQQWFSTLMADEQLAARIGETFEPVIEQNGYETDYQNLSGGEKTAVALAYRLALNKVVNDLIETMKTKDIIILDEPTDGFSSEQLDRMRDVLQALKLRQAIIVSHEPKIDTFVDNVIRIYKEGHVSRVER